MGMDAHKKRIWEGTIYENYSKFVGCPYKPAVTPDRE